MSQRILTEARIDFVQRWVSQLCCLLMAMAFLPPLPKTVGYAAAGVAIALIVADLVRQFWLGMEDARHRQRGEHPVASSGAPPGHGN